MPNQELINYIKECREKKSADDAIKSDLLKAGWAEGDVNEAFYFFSNSAQEIKKEPQNEEKITLNDILSVWWRATWPTALIVVALDIITAVLIIRFRMMFYSDPIKIFMYIPELLIFLYFFRVALTSKYKNIEIKIIRKK